MGTHIHAYIYLLTQIHTYIHNLQYVTPTQFEAEKLKVFMDKVRQSLEQQIHFLEKLDKSLMQVLYDVIKLRFKKEIAANNVLYTIIQRGNKEITKIIIYCFWKINT